MTTVTSYAGDGSLFTIEEDGVATRPNGRQCKVVKGQKIAMAQAVALGLVGKTPEPEPQPEPKPVKKSVAKKKAPVKPISKG